MIISKLYREILNVEFITRPGGHKALTVVFKIDLMTCIDYNIFYSNFKVQFVFDSLHTHKGEKIFPVVLLCNLPTKTK